MSGGGEPVSGGPESEGLSVVLAALSQIRKLALSVQGAQTWRQSTPDARLAVKEAALAVRQLESAYLGLVFDLDQRPDVVKGARAGVQARTFIRHALKRTSIQAKNDVAAAKALHVVADPALGGLPRLGAAFATGEVSRDHVDAAVAAAGRVPKEVLAAAANTGTRSETIGDASANAGAEAGAEAGGEQAAARCGGDVIDAEFTRFARQHDSAGLRRLTHELLDALDPDGKRSFNPDACLKRGLRLHRDSEGMWILRSELDPVAGAELKACLDHLAKPEPARKEKTEDGTLVDVTDTRTQAQRYADALAQIVKQAAAGGRLGTRGGEPPRVVIITNVDDLAATRAAQERSRPASHPTPAPASTSEPPERPERDGAGAESDQDGPRPWFNPFQAPPFRPASQQHHRIRHPGDGDGEGGRLATGERIDPLLLARLSCDSILQTVLLSPGGAILDLGREARTVTPAQRRALTARDKGCVIPGCTAPAHWCQGHHLTYWDDGGPTDIDNLALLCGRHHTEIHLGIWILTLRDGIPWITPPDWLDPAQTPLRNTYFHDTDAARRLGTQLRLDLGDP